MGHLKLDLRTFDVGADANSPDDYAEQVIRLVLESWDKGADVVLLPEFTWMGLERFVHGPDKLAGVAMLFWNQLWPALLPKLLRPDKCVVLGSAPFSDTDGTIKNRAPIVSNARALHQDKIHLTPWENAFSGGGPIRVWKFRGHKLAVVICLDVEIPEISTALRGSGLDLMLVPSATENLLGVERVGRCASARAVELGCHVGLCHLVGRMESELIDENIGQLAHFSPSQSPFMNTGRLNQSRVFHDGFHSKSVMLDMSALSLSRAAVQETDPSKIRPSAIRIEEV